MQKRGKGRDPLVLFRLPNDERDQLYALCEAQGITVSEFLRQAVRDQLGDVDQYALPRAS